MLDDKCLILFLSLFSAFIFCGSVSAASDTLTSDQQTMVMNTQIPFVENTQTDNGVKYSANTMYGTAYVTDDGIYHSITGENTTLVVKEEFLDEQGQVITFQPTGVEKGTSKVDFYMGNDSSKWVTGQTTLNVISLGEIYPGINVLLKAHGGNMEKIFQIEPGINPDIIKIRVTGADNLNIDADGNLNLQSTVGDVQLSKPTAYQDEEKIETNYILNDNTYGFQTTTYNITKTLTIDPKLTYSTFLGGISDDVGKAITIDNNGNIYITGYIWQIFDYNYFPTTPGAYDTTQGDSEIWDVFVSKIAPNKNGTADLLYSTIIGNNGNEFGKDIVLDEEGNIYITGWTHYIEFPTTIGAYQTNGSYGTDYAFVVKLAPNGNGSADLVYSTLIGGTGYGFGFPEDCCGYGIDVDSDGNIYITGCTCYIDFPTTIGAYQTTDNGGLNAFIAKIAPNGNGASDLLYCTLIGGSNDDVGKDIVVDDSGNVFIAGTTSSTDFPTYAKNPWGPYSGVNSGKTDGFICEFILKGNGAADLLYSTYIGGNEVDSIEGLALGKYDYIYITGTTNSSNFPTTSKAYQTTNHGGNDAFVAKIAANGWGETDLRYSTFLGGTYDDNAFDVALDSSDNIYITGATASTDFPATPGSVVTNHGGSDVYITKLVPIGYDTYHLGYTTFIGSSSNDQSHGIAIDNNGNIYITGTTYSNSFPTTPGAYQTIYAMGIGDAFVCKFSEVNTVYKKDQTNEPINITHILEILKLIADEIVKIFRGIWHIN